MFPKLFHVGTDKHLAQLDEITMLFVVDLNDTPWVRTTADLTAIGSVHLLNRPDYGEGNLARNLLSFSDSLLVLVLVGGRLEDADVVVGNVRKDLFPRFSTL